jgi:hypothetical protein
MDLSVVILVSKDDVEGIEKTLNSIDGLSAEIILYDTTDTDFAKQASLKYQTLHFKGKWEGYDYIRYKAAAKTAFDWVLMLHTGEELDEKLKASIRQLTLKDTGKAYRIRFKNYYKDKWLRHGEWGREFHIRLANKRIIRTDRQMINEQLFYQQNIPVEDLAGFIGHTIYNDGGQLSIRLKREALFLAAKYHLQGKKSGFMKMFLSPVCSFIKNYLFKLGILDGGPGLLLSKMHAWHNFLKYARLRQLNKMIRTPL